MDLTKSLKVKTNLLNAKSPPDSNLPVKLSKMMVQSLKRWKPQTPRDDPVNPYLTMYEYCR